MVSKDFVEVAKCLIVSALATIGRWLHLHIKRRNVGTVGSVKSSHNEEGGKDSHGSEK